ncbi:sporulation protein YqfD [Caldinitratiruptor microaerophilus]|uniref:Sporulation protein YqfD n=1 Tax=Caldinitratiruptor microaerophilus TaxID=671077 RepID=A0AA35CLA8_9FIRM|nr:sporulation protein YqfD [Caldinitratiruptor microaerophilus]BDG61409.1 sporulation protein YqfD [Caldinitratiruptor microaerophilus]
MLPGIWRYLAGTVLVEVTGPQPERFVNLAVDAGIDLWDVHRRPDRLRARMLAPDFLCVRPVARRARCRVRIRSRSGLPFAWRRLRRRRGLLAGAALSALVLLWAVGHVWAVEVEGTRLLDPRAVRAALARLGLHPGVWRVSVRPEAVERELPRLVPEVGWVSVRLDGTRAIVQVVERTTVRPPAPRGQVDIVARKPCIVDSVVVFRGRRRVQEGEVVTPGQVLIEGYLYHFSAPPQRPLFGGAPWPPVPDRPVGPIQADGQVFGRCFYEEYVEVPLYEEREEATGRRQGRVVLRLGRREILLKGSPAPPFARYRLQRRSVGLPGWRNWRPPVELTTEIYEETRLMRVPRSPEAAREEAIRSLEERVRWQLQPGTDRVVRREIQEKVRTPDYLGLRVLIETREEIGRPAPAPQAGPAQPGPGLRGEQARRG